jgi:acyl-ACP thioesterase
MSNLPAFYRRNHLVRHNECGANGNMKLQPVLDCLQNIAAEHAELLGCGMEDLVGKKRIWVLSRLRLRILRFPALKEELELLTYPSGHDRLMAFRQYCISCGGTDLIQASSAWVMLDGTTYRPLPMEKVFAEPLPENKDKPVFFEKFERFPAAEETSTHSFTVGAADIDLNRHLNNAVYARFVENVLNDLSCNAQQRIAEIQINFQHAGQLGETIGCSGTLTGKEFFVSGGKHFCAGGILDQE